MMKRFTFKQVKFMCVMLVVRYIQVILVNTHSYVVKVRVKMIRIYVILVKVFRVNVINRVMMINERMGGGRKRMGGGRKRMGDGGWMGEERGENVDEVGLGEFEGGDVVVLQNASQVPQQTLVTVLSGGNNIITITITITIMIIIILKMIKIKIIIIEIIIIIIII